MSSRCRDVARCAGLPLLVVALALGGCERETRRFEPAGPDTEALDKNLAAAMVERYERNAYALAAGKRLWTWYNCNGCHANGGGGSGPALMDEVWIYGGDAEAIVRSIAEGRPDGMPAFGGRIPRDQIWQLAAYVRSLAALAPQDAAPNRDDAFLTRTPESFMDPQKPETVKPSSGSGRPQ
jgi:cytochrome c oxidase cbb3-type subunit 3